MQKVFAHRGASGYAPENTLDAFELAIRQGAHGVELDVHLSKDGEVVVAHDETIDRVANGTGYIRDMTVAELKRFHFSKSYPAYQSATLPTLREVYELLKPTALSVNVELKTGVVDYPLLEEKCVALADEMGMTKRVLYSSFNHYSLLRVKEIDESLPCGILYQEIMAKPWAYAKMLGMEALHPSLMQLRISGVCKKAHDEGIQVNVWTPNEESQLRRAFAAGVDMVITNYPDRALDILRQMELGLSR